METDRRPTKIEEIDQFKMVERIPRSAISTEVLEGVRQLSELDHVEPFLRQIITDPTDTPHTSTEVADVITTHVSMNGKPVLAAFVNKGKSSQRVTLKLVSHQISRVRGIPNLNLIVLLAVGDIHDDAKLDLLQTAKDSGADYLIIDSVDVARLFIVHHKICPSDGHPFVEGICPECSTPASTPLKITIDVYEEPRYTLLGHNDVSHALAKRFRAEILTDPHYSKPIIREVVAKAVWELKASSYARSDMVAQSHKDRDADSVLLFVYTDLADRQQSNWICRAQWISPTLENGVRPQTISGDETFGEIEIDWKDDYEQRREFWSTHRGTKEEWVQKKKHLLPRMEAAIEKAENILRSGGESLFDQMADMEDLADGLYQESMNESWPPVECADCDTVFQTMMASFHNVFLYFFRKNKETWPDETKIILAKDSIEDFKKRRQRFDYEWEKLR